MSGVGGGRGGGGSGPTFVGKHAHARFRRGMNTTLALNREQRYSRQGSDRLKSINFKATGRAVMWGGGVLRIKGVLHK